MFHALSLPLQKGICFFQPLTPIPPTACLTVGLPDVAPGEVMGFPRSALLIKTDNLGGT